MQDHRVQKRHVHKVVDSPIGTLTLVATDEGLAAILWQNDRPRRVPLNTGAEDTGHPVLIETERQLREYFAGQRKEFALKLDVTGTVFQHKVWDALRHDPVRRNSVLRTDRGADRAPDCRARRRRCQRQEPRLDRDAVSSGHRIDGSAHRIRRGA